MMNQINLSHKIELAPTYKQMNYFSQACGIARFAYNWGLARWQELYQQGEKPSGFSLKKEFNAIKKNLYPWTYDVTKYACQQPFIHLQQAFNRFFAKDSQYPNFKKKGVHDSFYIGNDHIKVKGNYLKLPKLGWVKMKEACRFIGKIVSATISRVADRWFVSLQIQLQEHPKRCESQAIAGVDLGINKLATIYDGKEVIEFAGAKPLKCLLKKLAKAQRQLSRMQKGSRNRAKQRMKVARLHYRIRCIRQDYLHKLSTFLVMNYGTVIIEDLNVQGMMSNHRLARSISDMGFYEFRRQLEYKAELYGNHVEVVDRWFPSTKQCSNCHEVNSEITLSDRVFRCQHCDFECGRDENAARNLFSTVSSTGIYARGEVSAGSGLCLSETNLGEARIKPCTDLYRF